MGSNILWYLMWEVFGNLLPEVKPLMSSFGGQNPVNCGKPLKRFLPTCRGDTGKGQTNPLGMVKREMIGQSAAKRPGNRMKVQRLLGVI